MNLAPREGSRGLRGDAGAGLGEVGGAGVTIRRIPIPITPGPWALLEIDTPMTPDQWDQLIRILSAFKPGLVDELPGSGEPQGGGE